MSESMIRTSIRYFRKYIGVVVILIGLLVIGIPILLDKVPYNVYMPKIPEPFPQPEIPIVQSADFESPLPPESKASSVMAWVVQTEIFSTRQEAVQRVHWFKEQQYPAYYEKIDQDHYTVLIGPEVDSDRLEKWIENLKKQNIAAQKIEYEPVK